MKNKKWHSEVTVCDICKEPFGKYFIDGRIIVGSWGLMCEKCHAKVGCGLGIGNGQRYLTETREGVEGFSKEELE